MWVSKTAGTLTVVEKYYNSLQYSAIFFPQKPTQMDFSCTIPIDINGSNLPKTSAHFLKSHRWFLSVIF